VDNLTFANTKPGSQFVVVVAKQRYFFQRLVEEKPFKDGLPCGDCGTTTWNAKNESGTIVHFCPRTAIESIVRW